MDSFNKILSFILGLVAVFILLLVITRRLNKNNSFTFLPFSTKKVTPAPDKTFSPTSIVNVRPTSSSLVRSIAPSKVSPTAGTAPSGQTKGGFIAKTQITPTTAPNANTIPKTGAPTILTLISATSLFTGIYLRKKS